MTFKGQELIVVQKLLCLLSVLMFVIAVTHARTVPSYVIKRPGEASPILPGQRLLNHTGDQLDVIDEQVLAQEQFERIKMLELEGRESYQEGRKTSITRTY